jgi:hypothetical protein
MLQQGSESLPLTAWATFYQIIGSSAAALTGLQFVVMTLVVQSGRRASKPENAASMIAAFGSPTVVHLASALFIAVVMAAPWGSLLGASIPVIGCGVVGIAYVIVVARRARRQDGYKPVFEDWLWHVTLPLVAYLTLLIAAIVLPQFTTPALFAVGATTLLLVYIGIHNAWDTVVYMAVNQMQPTEGHKEGEKS